MENKTIKLDPSTLRKLREIKRQLAEEQYSTTLEDAVIYAIQHTHKDLLL